MRMLCMDELLNCFTGILEILSGLFTQVMNATVNAAVFQRVIIVDTIDDLFRFLGSSTIIEIYQRFIINFSAKQGKVVPDVIYIEIHDNKISNRNEYSRCNVTAHP